MAAHQEKQNMRFVQGDDLEKGNSSYEYNSYYEESEPPEEIDSNEVSVPDEIEDSQSFEPGMSGRNQ